MEGLGGTGQPRRQGGHSFNFMQEMKIFRLCPPPSPKKQKSWCPWRRAWCRRSPFFSVSYNGINSLLSDAWLSVGDRVHKVWHRFIVWHSYGSCRGICPIRLCQMVLRFLCSNVFLVRFSVWNFYFVFVGLGVCVYMDVSVWMLVVGMVVCLYVGLGVRLCVFPIYVWYDFPILRCPWSTFLKYRQTWVCNFIFCDWLSPFPISIFPCSCFIVLFVLVM